MRQRAAAGESLSNMPFVGKRQDGTLIAVSLSFSPVQDRAGPVGATIFAVEDITDQGGAWKQTRFQARLLQAVGQAVIATGLGGTVSYWNRPAEALYGWGSSEALGRDFMELTLSERARGQAAALMELLRRGESRTGEFECRRKDGSTFHGLVTHSPLMDAHDRLVGSIGVCADVGEIKGLEAQLRQSQKMEAQGRLAGGIAHDFNNLLTVIQGHAEMVLEDLPPGSEFRADLGEIIDQARRATSLTRPLLALSRDQSMDEKILDLRLAVARMEPLLRRLISSRIRLEFGPSEDPAWVNADPSQVDQVILNLMVNAADAIDGVGHIVIRVDEWELSPEESQSRPWTGPPGTYARLTVADSGSGMSSEVAERVFDPFFTTKPEGEGTGLGLSTVLGIVKQGAGHVLLDTEPHRGSTFQVLWPRAEPQGEVGTEEAAPRDGRDASDDRGVRADGEGVLLVDDDSAVRLVAQRALERAGYRVFPAADGQEALALVARHRDEIRVVVSDVVMPVMGGEGLLDRLEQIHPGLRVVLMSGYSEREITGDLRSRAAGFLDKPFGVNELIGVVHTILNR